MAAAFMALVLGGAARADDSSDEIEWGFDRQGADYREFVPEAADPTLCQEECSKEAPCRAWAYVKEYTVKGPHPWCFLKSSVPASKGNAAAVCGVKR